MDMIGLAERVAEARRRYEALPPEARKARDDAQRASWVRGMTARCEHGIADFEQCGECRSRALSEGGANHGR